MILGTRIFVVIMFIILPVLFTGTSCSTLSNVKAKIAGTVYIDGRPQAFGTVQAWKGSQLVTDNRCTDTGHYILAGLDPGEYAIVYLNARGIPIGGDTIVQVRLGRFETVDLELTVQGQ